MVAARILVARRLVRRLRPGRRHGTLLARLLGVLFLAMAAGQLSDMPGFRAILADYRWGDPELLSIALLGGELLAGGWLSFSPRRDPMVPAAVFAATALLWSGLAVQAFARGLVVENCGCFGVHLGQSLGWPVLVQDGLLLLYAAVLLRRARTRRGWPFR